MLGLVGSLLLTACTTVSDTGLTSPTPLASLSPLASPRPLASPLPTLTARQAVYVANAGGLGADFDRTPGRSDDRIRLLPDGSILQVTGRDQQVDGRTWNEAVDVTGTTGWVLRDVLNTSPPPLPTPTPMSFIGTPTPAVIPAPIVPSRAPAGPRPTDTLVPIAPLPPQAPGAPLPPAPTPRPTLPLLIPPPPVQPTAEDTDEEPVPARIRCQDGTTASAAAPGACSGHGGVAR